MNFNSFNFLFFYPIVLFFHFFTPLKYRWIALLAASIYFYMSWNPELIFLIFFTTAVSYLSGIIMDNTSNKKTKRVFLVLSLAASLGVLFFFKYFNFLSLSVTNILRAFSLPFSAVTLQLILPVGISFYTFQTLSYVIDVYRGNIPAERHFGYYALFVSFFPQLVAGPIERPENLLPQLKAEHKYNPVNAAAGGKIMLVGFFKKVVIADMIAPHVNAIFNNADSASGLGIFLASMLFAVQIYCDFSGYTDIAIGCAHIMGIRLMQNFNNPYGAENIRDFWARWHISLSSWFKDYLYIPLGGNRRSRLRNMGNVLVVFLVSGLWHGADWTFVIWGLLHGVYQVVGTLTQIPRSKLYKTIKLDASLPIARGFRRLTTFLLVCFAWVFFRANSPAELSVLLTRLFTRWGSPADAFSEMGFTLVSAVTAIVSVIIMAVMDKRITLPAAQSPTGESARLAGGTAIYAVWAIAFAWLILLSSDGASSFLYFQF